MKIDRRISRQTLVQKGGYASRMAFTGRAHQGDFAFGLQSTGLEYRHCLRVDRHTSEVVSHSPTINAFLAYFAFERIMFPLGKTRKRFRVRMAKK